MSQSTSHPTSTRKPVRTTKAAQVERMLRRKNGATLHELCAATDWQPHSCRAFLAGLRKKGIALLKEDRADGQTCYRAQA